MKKSSQLFEKFSVSGVNALPRFGNIEPSKSLLSEAANNYNSSNPIGVYFHIPFCLSICPFCMLRRGAQKSQTVPDDYIQALLTELTEKIKTFKIKEVDCLYIGGGTPSVMTTTQISHLIKSFLNTVKVTNDFEITFEGEPQTLKSKSKLAELKALGVARLSFGLQTFNTDLRDLLGRTDKIDEIHELISTANNLAFKDINVDYLYNLPGSEIDLLESDLSIIHNLPVTSVDCHPLKYISCSNALLKKIKEKRLRVPTPELRIEMFNFIKEQMNSNKFRAQFVDQYTTLDLNNSNIYMQHLYGMRDGEYLGIGAGARGHISNMAYTNLKSVEQYLNNIQNTRSAFDKIVCAPMIDNYIACFPKRNDNLHKSKIEESTYKAYYHSTLRELVDKNLVVNNVDGWNLSESGLDWYQNLQEVLLSPPQRALHIETATHRIKKFESFGNYFNQAGEIIPQNILNIA